MMACNKVSQKYISAIQRSGLSIYDPIDKNNKQFWIPTHLLEIILNEALRGTSFEGLPLRTRSKVLKEKVCIALGYPVPTTFKRTKPRFPGQCFDTYIQKSNNLQIWNEEISMDRRYVLIRVTDDNIISQVKVVTGNTLAPFDKTGALTSKYQACIVLGKFTTELVTKKDTTTLQSFVNSSYTVQSNTSPTNPPRDGELIPIGTLYEKLRTLVGYSFPDDGSDQERNRGANLHRLICSELGYSSFHDKGQFPDIPHQLLEVKLQTSPTIDLGLVCPNSPQKLKNIQIQGEPVCHSDVRYAIFYATITKGIVQLTNFFMTTGKHFFDRFVQFKGNVINRKIQIPLPPTFFSL